MKEALVAFLGGGVGTVFRYWLSGGVYRIVGSTFPYGILVVNISGCLLIGFFMAVFEDRFAVQPLLRIFLTVEVLRRCCGGHDRQRRSGGDDHRRTSSRHSIHTGHLEMRNCVRGEGLRFGKAPVTGGFAVAPEAVLSKGRPDCRRPGKASQGMRKRLTEPTVFFFRIMKSPRGSP